MKKSNCLMLMTTLDTGIDLDAIFKEEDLRDPGVEFDHHISIFYEEGDKRYGDFKEDMKEILGLSEYDTFMDFLNKEDYMFSVLDEFTISSFKNNENGDVVILVPKDNTVKNIVTKLNKGFTDKYNIQSQWDNYNPHLTLAYVNPGQGDKYVNSELLKLVLKDARIRFDDLLMSYGIDEDYEHIAITNYHTLERHFRLDDIKRK